MWNHISWLTLKRDFTKINQIQQDKISSIKTPNLFLNSPQNNFLSFQVFIYNAKNNQNWRDIISFSINDGIIHEWMTKVFAVCLAIFSFFFFCLTFTNSDNDTQKKTMKMAEMKFFAYRFIEHARLSVFVSTLRTIYKAITQYMIVYTSISTLSVRCRACKTLHSICCRWTFWNIF